MKWQVMTQLKHNEGIELSLVVTKRVHVYFCVCVYMQYSIEFYCQVTEVGKISG